MNRFAILLALGGALLLSIYLHVAPPQPAVEAEVTQSPPAVQRDGTSSTSMPTTDDARLETEARDVLRRYDIDASLADRMATDYAQAIRSAEELIVVLTDWLDGKADRIEAAPTAKGSRAIAETVRTTLHLAGRVTVRAQSLEPELDGLVHMDEERDALRETYAWMGEDRDIQFRFEADIDLHLNARLSDPVDQLFNDVETLARRADAARAQLRAQSESSADFEARWEALTDDLGELAEPEIERHADELDAAAERFGHAVEAFVEAHPFRVATDVLPAVVGEVDVEIDTR